MIKVLTGEVVPQTGDVWRHPNARVAYVAQHAFHHIEAHLNKTPNEYIRWRYANGEDKESLVKVSMVATEEESALQREAFEVVWKDDEGKVMKANKIVIELVGSRRENKQKEYEYEVKFRDGSEGYLTLKTLERRGWGKAAKAIDARIAQRSGLYVRTLSSANVEKHLGDCGLEAEFATHYRMSALSGGQKVKVVLAACVWNQPHIIILDEVKHISTHTYRLLKTYTTTNHTPTNEIRTLHQHNTKAHQLLGPRVARRPRQRHLRLRGRRRHHLAQQRVRVHALP